MAFLSTTRSIRILFLLSCASLFLDAQPTADVLQRVFMIDYKNERGTVFSIDIDGGEYWVTARHILTGAKSKPYGNYPDKTIEVKILDQKGDGTKWNPEKFTVLQPAGDIDIAVLVPAAPLLTEVFESPPTTSAGMMIGGKCEFLGFAYGGGWRGKFVKGSSMGEGTYWLPFIKHCGVTGEDTDKQVWFLDGINNPGFSGGPVIFDTGPQLKIAGVISGYISEPAEVIRGDVHAAKDVPADRVNLNSGFIVAYDIRYAVDLIKKNPIGPKFPRRRK